MIGWVEGGGQHSEGRSNDLLTIHWPVSIAKRAVRNPYQTQHIPHPAGPKRAELLYEAKYGDRGADGKMTREQVGAGARYSNGGAVWLCNLVV